MGVNLSQSKQKATFTPINLFILLLFAQVFTSSGAFLLFKAKSGYDFGLSFYITVTELLVFAVYSLIVGFKLADIGKLIRKYEEIFEMSKQNTFYI